MDVTTPAALARFRLKPTGFVLVLSLLLAGSAARAGAPVPAVERLDLPEGTIESRRVLLQAPEAACIAYVEAFSSRRWVVSAPSRGAFLGLLFGLDLSEASRAALADPAIWAELPGGQGFQLRPSLALLKNLTAPERRELYSLLAQWPQNKPERWPLVFPSPAPFDRLRTGGIPAPVIALLERLCYPFAGGLALSDFSVVAAEFPDRAMLLRLLRTTSTVEGPLPRLNIRTAAGITETLAYWTVNHHNPFAQPLLEALLDSEVTDGVELVSVLPGSARLLSFSVDPGDISHDTSLKSFLISASLASYPRSVTSTAEFLDWFDRAFGPAAKPYRYGDVLVVRYPGEPQMQYACAFIAGDLVFAKDPVGLGLWRFMRLDEVLARNPHFAGCRFDGYRLSSSSR